MAIRDLRLKKSIDGAVRFLEQGGNIAQSFKDSLEAGGVIVEDLMVVAGAVTGLLNSGLTKDAIIVLLQARLPKEANGRPRSASSISDVLDAMANLHHFVELPKTPQAKKATP